MSLLKRSWLTVVACVGLVACLVLLWPAIHAFLSYLFSVNSYKYAWAMTENENMLFIHGLMTGQNVYNLHGTTFFYDVYPPLFHLLSALFAKLFGFNILIPRLISLVALIALIKILFIFFRDRLSPIENTVHNLLLGALSIAFVPYAKYYVLARADLLGVALAFGSLYFLWQIYTVEKINRYAYIWAGVLAVAALYTKQSVFFPYLIVAGLIAVSSNQKNWLRFSAYLIGGTAATFLVLQLFTRGGFWQSMQLASQIYGHYLNSSQHLWWLQTAFISHFWPLLLSITVLTGLWIWSAIKQKTTLPFSLIAAVAIYLNFLITGGNQGAEYNTLIPLVFGLLLVAKELYIWGRAQGSPHWGSAIFIILCLLQINNLKHFTEPYLLPTAADRQNQESLISALRSSPSQTLLGDRIDYAILLAGKSSPLEASTHNVARDYVKTQPYAKQVEVNIIDRLRDDQISMAVTTITDFGKGDLLNYIMSNRQLVRTIKINYVDAPELVHRLFIP